ncbi:MAG: hypothetical protein ACJAT7_000187 [Psychromonas sp.]
MATIMKKNLLSLLFLICASTAWAHTIYAPNDIPLLDNRFRIDPHTEQVTFILNHDKGPEFIVLVRPDGSKIYPARHPSSVAWVSGEKEDIITINNPMAGPWQAVAELNENNRIKLISHVELKTNKLPLKLYSQEYITTHASLYYDNQLMTEQSYLDDAKLSVVLMAGAKTQLTLYQDDGKGYDALPFDGDLTARVYIDLPPGRYLLNIRTKNDVFLRNVNKDIVVFLPPVTYKVSTLNEGSKEAVFEFKVDSEEIDPESVIIDGVIKNSNNTVVEQLIVHSTGNISIENRFATTKALSYGVLTFSAKAFATTRSGREIELQLPDQQFELLPKFIVPEIKTSAAVATDTEFFKYNFSSLWQNSWLITAIAIICLIIISALIFMIRRRAKKRKSADGSDQPLAELKLDELSPTSINLKGNKK